MSIRTRKSVSIPLHFLVIVFLLLGTFAPSAFGSILYVDSRVPTSGDGASWAQAKQKIGEALTAAVADDEIWVATGTYIQTLTLKQGVALYGGFAGTESQREQRDPAQYPVQVRAAAGQLSTMSGNAVANVRIDGFSIRGGSVAGLMLTDVGATVVIDNCTFRGNPQKGIRCNR